MKKLCKSFCRSLCLLLCAAVLCGVVFSAGCTSQPGRENVPQNTAGQPAMTDPATPGATDVVTGMPEINDTDVPTDMPTEVVTDIPTDEPTEVPTEPVTDIPVTDEPTPDPVTSVPTVTPTPKPTNTPALTSAPTPTATVAPTAAPTATPRPTATPAPIPSWTEENIDPVTMYTTHSLNLRTAPDTTQDNIILTMPYGAQVTAIAHTSNNWYKVKYTKNNTEYTGYAHSKYLSTQKPESDNWTYPLRYSDSTMTITVYKEWYRHAYVYSAHIQFSDYKRVGMYNANGKYHSYCTTSQAAKQLNAILCVNGDYANADCFGLPFARQGKVYNDEIECWAVGFYNNHNGKLFLNGWGMPTHGRKLSEMVAEGIVTDTINFYYNVIVKNGESTVSDSEQNSSDRRPRTFIGTNEHPGDIWVFVADGDHRDGKSVGLNSWERAQWALSKGCTLCFGMDGGGSSTMVFRGHRLTGGNHSERAVVDFFFAR